MPLRRRPLAEGEEVVVDVRPHWWYLSGPTVVLVVVISGALTALVDAAPSWVAVLTAVAIAVAAVWLLGRYIRWTTTRLLLTTNRVIERRGVLSRVSREIPLLAITDIRCRRTIFERVIGSGDVILESAGRDSEEVFSDLPRPAEIQGAIYAQMEGRRAARAGGYSTPGYPAPGYPASGYRAPAYAADPYTDGRRWDGRRPTGYAGWGNPAAASIPEQIDQLDRLRRRGAITEQEFAAKKAELLDRL